MGISWQDVEDACAENRELAGVIRELERLHGGGTPIDWSQSRERCAEVLETFRDGHQPSQRLSLLFEGAEYEIGGDEHHLVRFRLAVSCEFPASVLVSLYCQDQTPRAPSL